MKVYDREGNVIEVQDWQGKVLNDDIRAAKVLEKRNAQFRLGPILFWSAWSAVILGCIGTVVLFAMSMLLWSGNHLSPAWASGFGALLLGIGTFFGMAGMVMYYNKHGIPKRLKEKPVELYCKKCQSKLEEEVEIGQQQRAQELLTELATLGVEVVPALEAPKDARDVAINRSLRVLRENQQSRPGWEEEQ